MSQFCFLKEIIYYFNFTIGEKIMKLLISIALLSLALTSFSGCSQSTDPQPNNTQTKTAQNNGSQANGQSEMLRSASITASKSDDPKALPSKVNDGDSTSTWNSGGNAPQWIQFDLGQTSSVSKLRLNISQEPAGRTVHEVYGGETSDKLELLGTLDGVTKDDQWIELPISQTKPRYIRIVTTTSPSWVSWREIQILK